MDNITALLHGFAVAATPINLLMALAGAFVGTIVGLLPGIGPINGVAILLPIAFAMKVPATSALILLAARLHGLRVRRPDHVDPGQHPGRRGLGDDHARRLPDGQEGRSRRRAVDLGVRVVLRRRCSRASGLVFFAPLLAQLGAGLRPRRVLRADGVRDRLPRRHGRRQPGEDAARLRAGPGPRDRGHRLEQRRLPVHLRRRPPVGRHPVRRHRDRAVLGLGDPADAGADRDWRCDAQGLGPCVVQPEGAVDGEVDHRARGAARFHRRRAAGGGGVDRQRDRLHDREEHQRQRPYLRQGRHSRRRRPRVGEQRRGGRRVHPDADAGRSRQRHHRGDDGRAHALQHQSRADAVHRPGRPRLGPDRVDVHRQLHAAADERPDGRPVRARC